MAEPIAARQKIQPSSFNRYFSRQSEALDEKTEKIEELKMNIQDAYREWQSALENFENAECKDMIDYYSYRIKASQIRYEYLLRKAKEVQV